ncbi:hypothetical protein D3C71_1221560 [compost metagenome]|jgi:hypothetical protein
MNESNQSSIESVSMEEVHEPMALAAHQTYGPPIAPIVDPFNELQASLNQMLKVISDRGRREELGPSSVEQGAR